MIILAIVAVLVIIIIAIVVSTQRKLVGADEFCENSLSQIGVQLNSRWDALIALSNIVKSFSEHEYKTLTDIIDKRAILSQRSSVSEVEGQESLLTQAASRIIAVSEAYPDLKSNQTYLELMTSLNDYEDKVRVSRMVYNDSVTKYNRIVREFPSNIVASIFKYFIKEYLTVDASKAEMPNMNL